MRLAIFISVGVGAVGMSAAVSDLLVLGRQLHTLEQFSQPVLATPKERAALIDTIVGESSQAIPGPRSYGVYRKRIAYVVDAVKKRTHGDLVITIPLGETLDERVAWLKAARAQEGRSRLSSEEALTYIFSPVSSFSKEVARTYSSPFETLLKAADFFEESYRALPLLCNDKQRKFITSMTQELEDIGARCTAFFQAAFDEDTTLNEITKKILPLRQALERLAYLVYASIALDITQGVEGSACAQWTILKNRVVACVTQGLSNLFTKAEVALRYKLVLFTEKYRGWLAQPHTKEELEAAFAESMHEAITHKRYIMLLMELMDIRCAQSAEEVRARLQWFHEQTAYLRLLEGLPLDMFPRDYCAWYHQEYQPWQQAHEAALARSGASR